MKLGAYSRDTLALLVRRQAGAAHVKEPFGRLSGKMFLLSNSSSWIQDINHPNRGRNVICPGRGMRIKKLECFPFRHAQRSLAFGYGKKLLYHELTFRYSGPEIGHDLALLTTKSILWHFNEIIEQISHTIRKTYCYRFLLLMPRKICTANHNISLPSPSKLFCNQRPFPMTDFTLRGHNSSVTQIGKKPAQMRNYFPPCMCVREKVARARRIATSETKDIFRH